MPVRASNSTTSRSSGIVCGPGAGHQPGGVAVAGETSAATRAFRDVPGDDRVAGQAAGQLPQRVLRGRDAGRGEEGASPLQIPLDHCRYLRGRGLDCSKRTGVPGGHEGLVRVVTTTPPTSGLANLRRSTESRSQHSRRPPSSREQSPLPIALPPPDDPCGSDTSSLAYPGAQLGDALAQCSPAPRIHAWCMIDGSLRV